MNDRLLTYAIAISVVAHLGAAVVIGGTSASRLSAAPPALVAKHVNIELIDLTAKEAPKAGQAPKVSLPKPAPPPPPEPKHTPAPIDHRTFTDTPNRTQPVATRVETPRPTTTQVPGNPGGKLNVGSVSAQGDLGGDWEGGRTPVGWVPGDEHGKGRGSGSGEGVGTPDPPKRADDGTGTRPAPAPPEPVMVSIRVCEDSGLLPGTHCKGTRTERFIDGRQPTRTCEKCQPEQKSRLADRAEPQLVKDSRPSVPSSVPEGMSLRVEVQYTVTADGDVADVQITKSSGYKALDRAVAKSASDMKYKPAIQDGIPRSVKKTRGYTINT